MITPGRTALITSAALAALITACSSGGADSPAINPAQVEYDRVVAALRACPAPSSVSSYDDDVVDIQADFASFQNIGGEESVDSGVFTPAESCVLNALGDDSALPDRILARMGPTRPIDGVQEVEVDGVTYRWSISSTKGLSLIIEVTR